jgi:hypothetical protein
MAVYIMAVACLCMLILQQLIRLPVKRTMIDDLQEVITPLEPLVGKQACISFISNNPSLELYFRTQFVTVPVILSRERDRDTILFVEDLQMAKDAARPDTMPHRVIATSAGKNFRVSMLVKER